MTERTIAFPPEPKVNTFLIITGKGGKDKDKEKGRKTKTDTKRSEPSKSLRAGPRLKKL